VAGAADTLQTTAVSLLALARRAAHAFREEATTPTLRLNLCRKLLAKEILDDRLERYWRALSNLSVSDRHHWVGTFYTLLLTKAERRERATYFTPPHLSSGLVSLACKAGFDPSTHTVVDPAAGGAAFLSTLAGQMSGLAPVRDVVRRLRGFELDSGLARLSEALIADLLAVDIEQGAVVTCRNSLTLRPTTQYDLVIANPPYGRVAVDDLTNQAWQEVCHPGHINKYALFTQLCFRLARPNGLVVLVLPSSFVAGPLYGKLRSFIRGNGEVALLGSVSDRDSVFVDVQQDISVLIVRAGTPHRRQANVTFGSFDARKPFRATGAAPLPPKTQDAWTPRTTGLVKGGATLADYGATVRSGYFVWNREKNRMNKVRRCKLEYPLIWAQNIRAGQLCVPQAKRRRGVDFVRFEGDTPAIVRTTAIVMQRTTNNAQPRRLIAARVAPAVLKLWKGFVSENHTIVITAESDVMLDLLCPLLNSAAVDARYRQLSGTASISVTLLRVLDLPPLQALKSALARNKNIEAAIEEAYLASASKLTSVGA
jgi:adenine-specific DNA-methyltransferase